MLDLARVVVDDGVQVIAAELAGRFLASKHTGLVGSFSYSFMYSHLNMEIGEGVRLFSPHIWS